jgi:CheY-like chemotaxis protein
MGDQIKTILVVDDEPFNLETIEEFLCDIDIKTVCVDSGEKALSTLQEFPQRFSAVLLDMVMIGMDGMDVLLRIKSDTRLNHIPVIMQSARISNKHISDALSAGALYYLTKPYDKNTLVDIVLTAVRDFQYCALTHDDLKRTSQTLKMMDKGVFSFKSLYEGRKLAAILANACPNSDVVVLGLTELMINAVEHGNLGIGYDEKSTLNATNDWENEVQRRLSLPQNKDKTVSIEFCRNRNEITFLIMDQGAGFDWEQYMEVSPERVFDTHGRGIALANKISFDQIKYLESGNKVCVKVSL